MISHTTTKCNTGKSLYLVQYTARLFFRSLFTLYLEPHEFEHHLAFLRPIKNLRQSLLLQRFNPSSPQSEVTFENIYAPKANGGGLYGI